MSVLQDCTVNFFLILSSIEDIIIRHEFYTKLKKSIFPLQGTNNLPAIIRPVIVKIVIEVIRLDFIIPISPSDDLIRVKRATIWISFNASPESVYILVVYV
jgi:hypothetical protein